MSTLEKAQQAGQAKTLLGTLDHATKNRALGAIIEALKDNRQAIVAANQGDLERAEKEALGAPLLKRLKFDDLKIEEACQGLASSIKLADPVGIVMRALELDQGLELFKVSSPSGEITIDGGAERAILKNGKSLLPSGIVDVQGRFRTGSAVALKNGKGKNIAVGLVTYNSDDLLQIKGAKTSAIEAILGYKHDDEVIHRVNLVLAALLDDDTGAS